ncbi:aminoglycoside 3'-phosphotransferase/choline kinase family protein [Streptomyces amakusaensis]|uniref:Phosphotransferase family protein n=1 Tax=Streptomyces amakusaensis TaxID=67271 RepID=A0ABW0ASB3_9ACTN
MLPVVETDAQGDAVVPDESVMRPGAEELCARLGFAGARLTRFPEGTQPVYAVGEAHVLKLFPGASASDAVTETRVLEHLQGRLPVPTPSVAASGAYVNGWRYVLMSRLPGTGLAAVWERLPAVDRERITAEAGETLAALHALDPEPLADVLGPGDWGAFLDRRRAAAVEQQRARGLPAALLERIPAFLDSVALPRSPRRTLLHTEFMREHFLLDPGARRLSGLFDFEPAMIGDRAYDLVAVGLFLTRGDPGLLRRFLSAYGESFEPAVLLAYTLLHVYSDLPWYLREVPVPAGADLPTIAEVWFGTG